MIHGSELDAKKVKFQKKKWIRFILMILFESFLIFGVFPFITIIINRYFQFLVINNWYFIAIGIIFLISGLIIIIFSVHALIIEPKQVMTKPNQALDNFIKSGIYRKMRNPMYVGYIFIIMAEFFLLGYILILGYFVFMVILIHLLVVFMEEPSLKKGYGTKYDEYCKEVPRWLPKFRLKRK